MKLKLKESREQKGYERREDLADASGIPERRIKSWEYGERNPTLGQAVKLADFLEVSLDELTGRSEYIGEHTDPRQTRLNEEFERLDDPSKDLAVAAVTGMAATCARG